VRIRKTVGRNFQNQAQEQPNRARRAVLTGGAVGLAAVAGTTLGTAQPASAGTTGLTEITPSADTTGVMDTKAIVNAINALPNGGVVYLGPGDFYISFVTNFSSSAFNAIIDVPAQTSTGTGGGKGVSIQGSGSATVVHVVDTTNSGYIGFHCHRTSGYGAQFGLPAQGTTSFLRDFVVDGTSAGTNATGVDIGDGWGYDLNLTIVNFEASGSIGLNIINRVSWTEKGRFRAQLMNNATAAVLDTTGGGDHSHEYNFYDFDIFCNEDQQGVVVNHGLNNGGCTLWLHGNMSLTSSSSGTPTNNVAALTLTGTDGSGDYSRFYFSEIVMKVEGNPGNGTGNTYPYGIYLGSSNNAIQQCHGIITHSLTGSNLNNGEFSFRGQISGDSNLSLAYTGAPGSGQTSTSPPPVPASTTAQQNYGPDQMVYVKGGTVSAITVNKVSTGQTSGAFLIPAGGIITLTYSVKPSWTWVPAAYTAY
jgi:hypothetical protein